MPSHQPETADDKYIVCGRGQRKYNNSGNKMLRLIVKQYLPIYIDQHTSRTSKSKIVDKATREIFEKGMVFVEPAKEKQGWDNLNYARARAKVAHRFRDAARRVYSGNDELPNHASHSGSDQDDGSCSKDGSRFSLPSAFATSVSQDKVECQSTLQDSILDSEIYRGIKEDVDALILSKFDNEEDSIFRKEQYCSLPPSNIASWTEQQCSNSLTSFLVINACPHAGAGQEDDIHPLNDEDVIDMLRPLLICEDDCEIEGRTMSIDEIDKQLKADDWFL